MREFTTVEVLRDLKTVTHAAARAPVAITQHRKARFVLMAIEDFERLRAAIAGCVMQSAPSITYYCQPFRASPATLISALVAHFPAAFVAGRWREHKPLKIGIAADLIAS